MLLMKVLSWDNLKKTLTFEITSLVIKKQPFQDDLLTIHFLFDLMPFKKHDHTHLILLTIPYFRFNLIFIVSNVNLSHSGLLKIIK